MKQNDNWRKSDDGRRPQNRYAKKDNFRKDESAKPSFGRNAGNSRPRRGAPRFGDEAAEPRFENKKPWQAKKENQRGERSFSDRKIDFRKKTDDYNPHAKYNKKKQMEFKKANFGSEPMRLNRYLANAGICSRREADDFIKAGVVSVNGQIVSELGTKVEMKDIVKFHDQPVRIERKVYILLNKPKDCVTTADDPQERLSVLDLVRDACSERVYPVGRLDKNTTGVLLLTNDGDLTARLTHPKFNKKKIYHVFLDKPVAEDDFQKILSGIELEDGEIHADALEIVSDDSCEIGIEIHSGRNRIVRRIFEHLGYKVQKLDRVYFAGLTKKNLPRGRYRFLTEKEVAMLQMGAYE